MSKIVTLDNTYDLWLSYTWSNNNHGVCGHTFEVIDYFYILKSHFKVGILLCEDITWESFESSIRAKYDFTEDEILEYKNNTVFHNRPSLVRGTNILFTDGGIVNIQNVTLLFKNILMFACGNKEIKDNTKKNVWILQDNRVYDPVSVNGINYKKRILFDRLKKVSDTPENKLLVYATKNCRDISDYSDLLSYQTPILAITNVENQPEPMDGVEFVIPPVDFLFDRFTKYLYTPVPRKWDCSPRFIAECHYYGKEVIYHNIDYLDIDKGLYWRKWDIENDFSSIWLKDDDEIIRIISGIV